MIGELNNGIDGSYVSEKDSFNPNPLHHSDSTDPIVVKEEPTDSGFNTSFGNISDVSAASQNYGMAHATYPSSAHQSTPHNMSQSSTSSHHVLDNSIAKPSFAVATDSTGQTPEGQSSMVSVDYDLLKVCLNHCALFVPHCV